MKIHTAFALGAVVVSGSFLAASRALSPPEFSAVPSIPQTVPESVAFTNVNVVPMDAERILTNQTVLIQQGRIRRMGPADQTPVPFRCHHGGRRW